MNKCFKIASIDFSIKRKNGFVGILLCFCTMLLLIFSSLQNGFYQITNSYKTDRRDLRIVEVMSSSGQNGDFDNIVSINHIESAFQKINLRTSDNFSVELSGKLISCYSIIEGINRRYSIDGIEIKEFSNSSTGNNYHTESDYPEHIVSGRSFHSDDSRKAILDENICWIFGLSFEEVLGKVLHFSFNDEVSMDVEIIGVMDNKYSNMYLDYSKIKENEKESIQKKQFYSPFWLSDDAIIEIASLLKESEWWYEDLKLFADNTDNVTKICNTVTDNFGFQTDNEINKIEKIQDTVKGITLIGIFVGCVFFIMPLLCIVNSIIIKYDRQKKFVEMLLMIGYKPFDVIQIYILETAFLVLISDGIAFGFSYLVGLIIDDAFWCDYSVLTDIESGAFLPSIDSTITIFTVELCIVLIASLLTTINQIKKYHNER